MHAWQEVKTASLLSENQSVSISCTEPAQRQQGLGHTGRIGDHVLFLALFTSLPLRHNASLMRVINIGHNFQRSTDAGFVALAVSFCVVVHDDRYCFVVGRDGESGSLGGHHPPGFHQAGKSVPGKPFHF